MRNLHPPLSLDHMKPFAMVATQSDSPSKNLTGGRTKTVQSSLLVGGSVVQLHSFANAGVPYRGNRLFAEVAVVVRDSERGEISFSPQRTRLTPTMRGTEKPRLPLGFVVRLMGSNQKQYGSCTQLGVVLNGLTNCISISFRNAGVNQKAIGFHLPHTRECLFAIIGERDLEILLGKGDSN